jgi:hypothetical protein
MIIVVKHKINNPENFWASAQQHLPNLPEMGVNRVLQVLPNETMNIATCVWEAESIESLDKYLRDKVKDWSEDAYQEVNMTNATGLTL